MAFLIVGTIANVAALRPVERWGLGSITLALILLAGIILLWGPRRVPDRQG